MTWSMIRSAISSSLSSTPGERLRQTGISSSTGCPVESSRSLSRRAIPIPAKTAAWAARQTGSVSMSRPSMSRTTASTGARFNTAGPTSTGHRGRRTDLAGGVHEPAGPAGGDGIPGDAVDLEAGGPDHAVGDGEDLGQPVGGHAGVRQYRGLRRGLLGRAQVAHDE